MKLGTTELILILVVALVVFGPSKLPELGKLAGQAVGSFKKYVNSFEGEWKEDAGPVRTEQAAKKTAETQAVMTEETASQMKSENREQAEGIRKPPYSRKLLKRRKEEKNETWYDRTVNNYGHSNSDIWAEEITPAWQGNGADDREF